MDPVSLIAAITALVVALTALIGSFRTVRETAKEVTSTAKKVTSIDEAVNHKETGMPTLVQRVINQDDRGVQLAEELAVFREWTQDAFMAFSKAQGVELRPIPTAVAPTNVQLPQDAEHPQDDPSLTQSPTPSQAPEHGDRSSLTGDTHKA